MILVDTGAWYALSVASDPDHERASRFVAENRERLVTTDYVVDELLTLFRIRRQYAEAIRWLDDVLDAGHVDLIDIQSRDFGQAIVIYRRYRDKLWSFTDCTSLAISQRLQITKAFTFDKHFQQFGTLTVLP